MNIMNAHINLATLPADVQAYIKSLEAQANKPSSLTLKVSKKGGVSMYGLGRYPLTQYKQGWARIIDLIKSGELETFIERNMALLSTGKDDPRFADIGDE